MISLNLALKALEVIVFDYGRTLFDRESNQFFPDAQSVLTELSKNYRLAIVSYSKPSEVAERIQLLKEAGLYDLFSSIVFTDQPEKKHTEYHNFARSASVEPNQMAIVDDHLIRGVLWGYRNSSITFWFKNGKFSDVVPSEEVGLPTYTISTLTEIIEILDGCRQNV
jgi:FMN phosphatase YigB (HAD superfamily)